MGPFGRTIVLRTLAGRTFIEFGRIRDRRRDALPSTVGLLASLKRS